MANEATQVVRVSPPIFMTVADGAPIEKGAVLQLTDPFTASLATGTGNIVAGIAGAEKISGSGVTTLQVYRDGIFKMFISGTATVGAPLQTLFAPNFVDVAVARISGSVVLGTILETATNGQTALVEIRPQVLVQGDTG